MIKTEQAPLNIHAASHPGMTGKENEDRYRVTSFLADTDPQTQSVLGVLCDGVGGHRAGEVAAEMGVTLITEEITAGGIEVPLETMHRAILTASRAIYQASLEHRGRKGMGATCACAWVIGDRLYTANLGDSRIYLLRDRQLVQLTTDHTWIQEAIDAGVLRDQDNMDPPHAHVIRRYLGSRKSPEPDFRLWFFEGEDDDDAQANQGLQLQSGDKLLLCSDGLTDLVSDETLRIVLLRTPAKDVPQALIKMVNQQGGYDNTTVVLMAVPTGKIPDLKRNRKKWRRIGFLAALITAPVLILAFWVGIRWLRGDLDTTIASPTAVLQATLPAGLSDPTDTPSKGPTETATLLVDSTQEVMPPAYTRTPWPTNTLQE